MRGMVRRWNWLACFDNLTTLPFSSLHVEPYHGEIADDGSRLPF